MSKKPDILFIVLDTQRADRLGCYGYPKAITPNLDRFVQQGAIFQQGMSAAQWTIPSHASMFTGLYPTVHQVTQSNQQLSPDIPHLAELMTDAGYETAAFCNNPLVGILDNGFQRGFEQFYNYGGAVPRVFEEGSRLPPPFNKLAQGIRGLMRQIAQPAQQLIAMSPKALSISVSAWFTPIWSRLGNFKGQNERSVRHLTKFLQQREESNGANGSEERPLFMFLNLMETHFPFWPPAEFLDKINPELLKNRVTKNEMLRWNREAYRWVAPLDKPLTAVEAQVLSDLYDAEVAYQDDYLGMLFDVINSRANRENTITIIVGDHGDGLGEHQCVGHAFVAYQELVHVPLIMHWPGKIDANTSVEEPVSTRRVYHTMLNAAGLNDRKSLSLLNVLAGNDVENGTAYSEIYPPLNFIDVLKTRHPELIDKFRCLAMRRSVVRDGFKLIDVDDRQDELFDLAIDPEELTDILPDNPPQVTAMHSDLLAFVENVEEQQTAVNAMGSTFEVQDERLLQQLRGLGYIE